MGEQGLGSTPALTVLHWHKLALHSALLGGKEPMAAGVSATTEPQLRQNNVLPALESWAVAAPAVGHSSSSSCILMELTRRLHCPQTCRTSPWLSAKSSQSLAGERERSPGLTLLRGEQQVFCVVELVKEFLVSLASRHIMC